MTLISRLVPKHLKHLYLLPLLLLSWLSYSYRLMASSQFSEEQAGRFFGKVRKLTRLCLLYMGLSLPISSQRQSMDQDRSPQQWWKSTFFPVYILFIKFICDLPAYSGSLRVRNGYGVTLGFFACIKLDQLCKRTTYCQMKNTVSQQGLFQSTLKSQHPNLRPQLYSFIFPHITMATFAAPIIFVLKPSFSIDQQFFHRAQSMMRLSSQCILTKRKPRAISSFLKKTYQLLNDHQNQHIVKWALNGIGFVVVDQDAFSKEILPKYFKHSNYSSFVRQLNMYNFHKIRENNTESYFHHQSFDRYNEQNLVDIKRKPEKKKRKNEETDEEMHSQREEKECQRPVPQKKVKEVPKFMKLVEHVVSLKKVEEEKNTRHFVSQQYNGQQENCSLRNIGEDIDDDKISINNDISERVIPRLATRELINPSNSNLFPFGAGKGQTSNFCLFY